MSTQTTAMPAAPTTAQPGQAHITPAMLRDLRRALLMDRDGPSRHRLGLQGSFTLELERQWQSLSTAGRPMVMCSAESARLSWTPENLLDSALLEIDGQTRIRAEMALRGDQTITMGSVLIDMTPLSAEQRCELELLCLGGEAQILEMENSVLATIWQADPTLRDVPSGMPLIPSSNASDMLEWVAGLPDPGKVKPLPTSVLRLGPFERRHSSQVARQVALWWHLGAPIHRGRSSRLISPRSLTLLWLTRDQHWKAQAGHRQDHTQTLLIDLGAHHLSGDEAATHEQWLSDIPGARGYGERRLDRRGHRHAMLWKAWAPDPQNPGRTVALVGYHNDQRGRRKREITLWSAPAQPRTVQPQSAQPQHTGGGA